MAPTTTPSPLARVPSITVTGEPPPHELSRTVLRRRLAYIMLVRVILFTLVLGGTVAVNIVWRTPEELGGPYVSFLFV